MYIYIYIDIYIHIHIYNIYIAVRASVSVLGRLERGREIECRCALGYHALGGIALGGEAERLSARVPSGTRIRARAHAHIHPHATALNSLCR